MANGSEPQIIAYEGLDSERPASSTPAIDVTPPHDPYQALRHRGFAVYVVGWLVSIIGDQMMEVAVGWDIYQRTRNPLSLGLVGLVTAAPVILLALPSGHLADRADRRWLVFVSQLMWAACVTGLGIMSFARSPVAWMYGLLFLTAVCKAIGGPARAALLPMLVPTEVFANAVSWNSSGFQLAAMAGPAIGGLIIVWSVPGAYFISAGCAAAFAIFLLALKLRKNITHREPVSMRSLAAGVEFVWQTKIILATITLDLFAVLLGGAVYLLPVYASDILHVGSTGFGWLRAAPAVGALLMAMIVAHLPPMKRAGLSMLWAVTGFGAATIVFGLSHSFWLSMAMLFLTGAFDNISVLVRHTLVQVLTPDSMRGRVSAVNNVFIGASNELGGFESGAVAKLLGPVGSVVGGGIGTLIVVALVAWRWPEVRRFGSLANASPVSHDKLTHSKGLSPVNSDH